MMGANFTLVYSLPRVGDRPTCGFLDHTIKCFCLNPSSKILLVNPGCRPI